MSYYFSSFSYSSSSSNGKNMQESAKGYSRSSSGPEDFFVYQKENEKVLKDVKGNRKQSSENFNVVENKKTSKKTEKEVYNLLIESYPYVDTRIIKDFIQSPQFKQLEGSSKNTSTSKSASSTSSRSKSTSSTSKSTSSTSKSTSSTKKATPKQKGGS
jgi:hypothetical protein